MKKLPAIVLFDVVPEIRILSPTTKPSPLVDLKSPEEAVIVEVDLVKVKVLPPEALIVTAVDGIATVPPKVMVLASDDVTFGPSNFSVLPTAATKYNLVVGIYLATMDALPAYASCDTIVSATLITVAVTLLIVNVELLDEVSVPLATNASPIEYPSVINDPELAVILLVTRTAVDEADSSTGVSLTVNTVVATFVMVNVSLLLAVPVIVTLSPITNPSETKFPDDAVMVLVPSSKVMVLPPDAATLSPSNFNVR